MSLGGQANHGLAPPGRPETVCVGATPHKAQEVTASDLKCLSRASQRTIVKNISQPHKRSVGPSIENRREE